MPIKVGIVGVGNCSCSLAQAIEAAKQGKLDTGLKYPSLYDYKVDDIEIVVGFDVDSRKIGKDIGEAIFSPPNCTSRYFDVSATGVVVQPGPLLDGINPLLLKNFPIDQRCQKLSHKDVTKALLQSKTEVLILYLPVGSQKAAEEYAQAALDAGCALVNCTPAVIANNGQWAEKFADRELPLLGDDIKSQIGSTAIHQALLRILNDRGGNIIDTYQLNIGGNSDFENMRLPERGGHKKITKEKSLSDLIPQKFNMSVGPSDFVPHMKDHKTGYIHITGKALLGMDFNIELRLTVEDSPNSAGVVIDAIRTAKHFLVTRSGGTDREACESFFKAPAATFKMALATT